MFRSRCAVGTVCLPAAVPLMLLGATARPARSDVPLPDPPIELEWSAPPECPGRDTVLAQIRRVLGDAPPASVHLSARVSVTRGDEGRWHVRIVMLDDPDGERTIESASCSALTGAAALVLAIRIKPTLLSAGTAGAGDAIRPSAMAAIPPPPPPAPPNPVPMPVRLDVPANAQALANTTRPAASRPSVPEPRVAAPRHEHGSFGVGVSVLAGLGELPSADASAELEITYELARLRVELHGETGLVQDVLVSSTPGTNATFRSASGGVRGCYGPSWGAFGLFGGADGEADAIWANGHGFATSFEPKGVWLTLGALVGARYRLTKRLAIHGFVEALAPVERPTFVTETSTGAEERVVHQPSAAWARAGLGVDAIFF